MPHAFTTALANRQRRKFRSAFAKLKFAIRRVRREFERRAPKSFDPNQARDRNGRWTSTGNSGGLAQQTFTDLNGDGGWDGLASDFGADGSLLGQVAFNADGSSITSEFNASDASLPWDERNTVVTTDGARIQFETAGNTQTIRDANTGNVISSSTWTPSGPVPDATVQPAFLRAAPAIGVATAEAAAMLYSYWSMQNSADALAVLSFRANEYTPGATKLDDATWVGRLSKDQVEAACPRFGEVQDRTNAAADAVTREGNTWTPARLRNRGSPPRERGC